VRLLQTNAHLLAQAVEVVARGGGQQHGGQLIGVNKLVAPKDILALEKAHVEVDVVAQQRGGPDEALDLAQNLADARRIEDVFLADAGQVGDVGRDLALRVDQSCECVHLFPVAEAGQADLDNGIVLRIQAGGFQVNRDDFATHDGVRILARSRASLWGGHKTVARVYHTPWRDTNKRAKARPPDAC